MKTNFTKLVSLAAASLCALSVVGQERMPAMGMGEERVIVEREDIRTRAGETQQPDSVVMYRELGEADRVYYYVGARPGVFYHEEYESWGISTDHFWGWEVYPVVSDPDVKYNSRGLVESMTYRYERHDNDSRIQFIYNADGYLTSYEFYSASGNTWDFVSRTTYLYDAYGNWVGVHDSQVDMITYSARVDDKGRIVYSENHYCDDCYTVIDGKESRLQYYVWYYSDSRTPTIEPENNTPIGESNEGSFDLDINIPSDSINNGSLVITLPEGFTLDEANTSLTLDFSGDFSLKITKQDNNSWLLEITPKSTRNASLRVAAEAKTLLNIAYKVAADTKQGTYDIVVNSILFESKGGNNYPEPAITIPAEVSRLGVSNEQVGTSTPNAYIANNTLYITATQSEQIAVYTLTGIKLYEATVSAGTTTIDAAFPQGVLIVKGNSWTAKIKN